MHAVFASPQALATAFVSASSLSASAAMAARGRCHVALTGGSTAGLLYPALAQAPIAWGQVSFYWGDERCVPANHDDSNQRLAHHTLLSHTPGATIVAMDGTAPGPVAAVAYEALLPPQLDVVHLGIGPDGHICSLFPGHLLLHERSVRVASLTDSPKPPSRRITLTLRALQEAREVWLFAMGAAKADVVHAMLIDKDPSLPATEVASWSHARVWLDADAGRGLSR
jgi:6-phosphogluconolactonase